ncbi:calcium-activated chloride channel regulator 1-like [Clavelina lepadiformis]|uniref:calcium-activated chloride channel regulator 1-like n=1 Tax=Clavelina lepadiformis TaxID=159417 RepID=UPI0040418BC2
MNLPAGLWFILCLLTSFYGLGLSSSAVTISNNGYSGLLIAINPEVPESSGLIDAIKEVWTNASKALYTATKQRAYFASITILVPKSWSMGTYQSAGKETYNAADVLVAYRNPVYQDQPYTLQYGGCGEPGTYIHLTPSYLVNDSFVNIFGPKGKAMVHEWGHYRWGVFDETPTYGYNSFYQNSLGQIEATRWENVEATRCPVNLKGEFKVIDYSTGTARDCQRNVQNRLPEDGCVFLPYEKQLSNLTSSIMSNQYVEKVELFCHNEKIDPYNIHNKEAPNEQNRMCNLRSTWEVILDSSDFANANSPNVAILDTSPTFHVVKLTSSKRHVLVLDTSGSMGWKEGLEQMLQAVSIFIAQFVPIGDRVALVEFDSVAQKLTNLCTIKDETSREDLLNNLPTTAGGNTCIGCGLEKSLKILEEGGEDPTGGNIVVFTDGEESEYPFVNAVADQVLQAGSVVHAIFFNTNSNDDLKKLVVDSSGIWFYGTDVNSILGAFETLSSSNDGDVYSKTFQVHSSTFDVDKNSIFSGIVDIDSTVGNSTVFTFTWGQYDAQVHVVLQHPSGCSYSTNLVGIVDKCPGQPLHKIDSTFKVVNFPLPGTADPGRWRYYVSSTATSSQTVVASVTSQASDQTKQPIVVSSGLDKTSAGTGEAIVVYAQVSQGFAPVLDANVLALIQQPDGTVKELELFDAGGAPDVRANDGVYSRFFTSYSDSGSYGVRVRVSKTANSIKATHVAGSRSPVNLGTIKSDGSVSIDPEGINYVRNDVGLSIETGNFSREVTNEGFQYIGQAVTKTDDFFPPNAVKDLKAEQKSLTNSESGVALIFTAPGDDYDQGTAFRYELRYVINNVTQLADAFENCTLVEDTDVIEGNLTQPKAAETKETFLISNNFPFPMKGQVTLGFALLAIDESGNRADPSNVAPVAYLYSPPVVIQPSTKGDASRVVATMTSLAFLTVVLLHYIY